MSPHTIAIATVALAAAVIPFAASAQGVQAGVAKSHLVVVNKGVAGVKLGEKENSVKKELGAPDSTSPHCGGSANKTAGCVVWTYKKTKREIAIAHKKLLYIVIGSPEDKTKTDIGLKATRATVDRAYSKCPDDFGYCILTGKGTNKYPKSGKPVTLVDFSSESSNAKVDGIVIATYGSKYDDCVFGCG